MRYHVLVINADELISSAKRDPKSQEIEYLLTLDEKGLKKHKEERADNALFFQIVENNIFSCHFSMFFSSVNENFFSSFLRKK